MKNSASLLHELWTDQGSRLLRYHLVLLLFDIYCHGWTRPASASGGHLSPLPRAVGLAARQPLRHPGQDVQAYQGQAQEGPQEVKQQEPQWEQEQQNIVMFFLQNGESVRRLFIFLRHLMAGIHISEKGKGGGGVGTNIRFIPKV